jgi:hypothetical protein
LVVVPGCPRSCEVAAEAVDEALLVGAHAGKVLDFVVLTACPRKSGGGSPRQW